MANAKKSKKIVKMDEKDLTVTKICPVAPVMAQVHISLGATINVGNYESFKILCGLTLPSEVEEDSINKTIDKVDKVVSKMLSEQLKKVKG